MLIVLNAFFIHQMWSMDYVQVPEERAEPEEVAKEEIVEESKEVIKEKKKAELVKQMSLSTDGGGKKICLTFL